jgi:ubiquinone/menaquinone biosynthesis C-methylase UbiE
MSGDSVFDGATIAAGYATARPPVHPLVIEKVSARLGIDAPVRRALDVGCGAGISTRALGPIAHHCIGIDPAREMIQQAPAVFPAAQFLVARTEALPVPDRSVEFVTAVGSLNYGDLDQCLSEAARVMTHDGVLVAYDFSFGRRSADSAAVAEWYAEHIARWPRTTAGRREIEPSMLARGQLELVAAENFTVEITLGLDAYIDYAMTEANVAYAIEAGTPATEIRAWCRDQLAAAFAAPRRIQFDGYFACLTTR